MTIRKSDISKRMRVAKAVIAKFSEEMEKAAKRMHLPDGSLEKVSWDLEHAEWSEEEHDAFILAMRKRLANEIKIGMLERKDREAEIAINAMIVWFLRLDAAKRSRMLEQW